MGRVDDTLLVVEGMPLAPLLKRGTREAPGVAAGVAPPSLADAGRSPRWVRLPRDCCAERSAAVRAVWGRAILEALAAAGDSLALLGRPKVRAAVAALVVEVEGVDATREMLRAEGVCAGQRGDGAALCQS